MKPRDSLSVQTRYGIARRDHGALLGIANKAGSVPEYDIGNPTLTRVGRGGRVTRSNASGLQKSHDITIDFRFEPRILGFMLSRRSLICEFLLFHLRS